MCVCVYERGCNEAREGIEFETAIVASFHLNSNLKNARLQALLLVLSSTTSAPVYYSLGAVAVTGPWRQPQRSVRSSAAQQPVSAPGCAVEGCRR